MTRPALPSAEQVEACAWLVENAAAVARTIGEVFAEEAGAPRNVRPSVGSRAVLGEWEFAVAEVFIRAPVAAGVAGVAQPTRSNVVLRGACGWDEEHGFALELSRGAVVMHGSWSCVPVP